MTYAIIQSAGHDSALTVVYPGGPDQPPQAVHNVRIPSLPFISLVWISENAIVAAGHDYEPMLFTGSAAAGWTISKSLDDPSSRAHTTVGSKAPSAGGIGRLNNKPSTASKLPIREVSLHPVLELASEPAISTRVESETRLIRTLLPA